MRRGYKSVTKAGEFEGNLGIEGNWGELFCLIGENYFLIGTNGIKQMFIMGLSIDMGGVFKSIIGAYGDNTDECHTLVRMLDTIKSE